MRKADKHLVDRRGDKDFGELVFSGDTRASGVA
jgi:hypothetical protein